MTSIRRRDVLMGLGGGIAGTLFTPLPWTALDDVAVWTQHRHALPIPRDGETAVRPAACTLCPAGCPVRVRSVAGRPVFVAGEPLHPLGGGMCAFGVTLHHLAHHPLRISGPARLGADGAPTRIALGAAVAAIAAALGHADRSGQNVLVLDQRPGRVVSRACRELLAAVPRGVYATPSGEGMTLAALRPEPAAPLGIDLERTRTLLSFGAPVLEGWGRPGRMIAARDHLRVVQLDAWCSPTAGLADQWLAVRPGCEGALALALAHVVASGARLPPPANEVQRLLSLFSPARVALLTGLEAGVIESLGRSLVAHGPTVAVGGGDPAGGPLRADDERAIALLNVVLGSVGRPGGIVARRPVPEEDAPALVPERPLTDVPDGQTGLLLMDASDAGRALPWPVLERKLAPGALVVSLSPFLAGLARHAHVLVPAPAHLEDYDEVLPTADAAVASYALSAPLLPAAQAATDPVVLLQRVAEAAALSLPGESFADRLRRRVDAIRASRRGRLLARHDDGFREEPAPSAEVFWQSLVDGGVWIDGSDVVSLAASAPLPSPDAVERWLRPPAARTDLALVAFGARGASGGVPVSPILSKLYQETDLRPSVSTVALHPQTAREHGLAEGRALRVESAAGIVEARLRCDASLPPGRVALASGPGPGDMNPTRRGTAVGALPLSVVEPDLTWRGTRVTIREA